MGGWWGGYSGLLLPSRPRGETDAACVQAVERSSDLFACVSSLCINKLLRTDLSRGHLHIFLQIFSRPPQSPTVWEERECR